MSPSRQAATSPGEVRRGGGRLLVGAAAVVAMVLAGACGGDRNVEESRAGGEAVPPAEQVDIGAELYEANCAACHGSDLRGTDRGPSHLSIVYEPGHHGDDAFRSAITNGAPAHHWEFGDMPALPGLSPAEVDAVIAYIRDAQRREGFEP